MFVFLIYWHIQRGHTVRASHIHITSPTLGCKHLAFTVHVRTTKPEQSRVKLTRNVNCFRCSGSSFVTNVSHFDSTLTLRGHLEVAGKRIWRLDLDSGACGSRGFAPFCIVPCLRIKPSLPESLHLCCNRPGVDVNVLPALATV